MQKALKNVNEASHVICYIMLIDLNTECAGSGLICGKSQTHYFLSSSRIYSNQARRPNQGNLLN